jgi:hypothetical protein
LFDLPNQIFLKGLNTYADRQPRLLQEARRKPGVKYRGFPGTTTGIEDQKSVAHQLVKQFLCSGTATKEDRCIFYLKTLQGFIRFVRLWMVKQETGHTVFKIPHCPIQIIFELLCVRSILGDTDLNHILDGGFGSFLFGSSDDMDANLPAHYS